MAGGNERGRHEKGTDAANRARSLAAAPFEILPERRKGRAASWHRESPKHPQQLRHRDARRRPRTQASLLHTRGHILVQAHRCQSGRPLAEVTLRFVDSDLLLDAETVIATSVTLWREVEADNGAWYNRRLLPYRNANNDIEGVVVTFSDISEMKAAEREIQTAHAYSNSIVDAIRQPLVVLDHELRVVSASPSFYRSFAIKPESAVGRQLPELRDRCLDVQALRSFLDRIAGRT